MKKLLKLFVVVTMVFSIMWIATPETEAGFCDVNADDPIPEVECPK